MIDFITLSRHICFCHISPPFKYRDSVLCGKIYCKRKKKLKL